LAVFEHQRSRSHDERLLLVGIYSCLLCERRFSTKLQLNQHYRNRHREDIQDYEGKGAVLVFWRPRLLRKPRDFQDAYKRMDEQTD
jgi:hypothetical protein